MPGVEPFQVSHYVVELGWNEISQDAGSSGTAKVCATIRCFDASPATKALFVRFQPQGEQSAGNTYDPGGFHGKTGVVYRPWNEYALFLDLLRNEGPVYALLFTENPEYHYIATDKEPVGEGERRDVVVKLTT